MSNITIVDPKKPNKPIIVELFGSMETESVDNKDEDITNEQIQQNIKKSNYILNMFSSMEM